MIKMTEIRKLTTQELNKKLEENKKKPAKKKADANVQQMSLF